MEYKTWSSVSNSKFSKTFVPGSLESIKFRSFVLSFQRSFSLKFILGEKKFWVWKKFGSKKNFGPTKSLNLKKFSSKNLRSKNMFRWKKFWVPKIFFVPKKTSGPKKFLVQNKFCTISAIFGLDLHHFGPIFGSNLHQVTQQNNPTTKVMLG